MQVAHLEKLALLNMSNTNKDDTGDNKNKY